VLTLNKLSVPPRDTASRSSTGIRTPPLIPVDDDGRSDELPATHVAPGPPAETVGCLDKAPSSLELLRQLEACVRELLEISALG